VVRRQLAVLAAALACLAAIPASASAELGILRVFGSEGKGYGQFLLPDGIAVDDAGTIWVADRDANRILRFANDGTPRPFKPFRYQPWSSAPGRFRLPYDVDVDGLGNLYVADTHNHRIQVFTPQGKLIRKWGRNGGDGTAGTGDGEFDQPRDLALDAFGNVWVADHENKRVQKFTADGRFLGRFGANGGDGSLGSAPGEFNSPRGVSSDAQGNIYVADDANHRVQKLANDGRVLAVYGRNGGGFDQAGSELGAFSLPYGTAVDGRGGLWVADTNNNRVVQMTTDGLFVRNWGANGGDGSEGDGPGEFEHTYNIASDCAGNVYVTDEDNHRVQVIGDAAYGKPVCPPGLKVSGERARLAARVIEITGTCDRACYLSGVATIRRVGAKTLVLRSKRAVLPNGGTQVVRIGVPAGVSASSVRGKIGLVVTASGPPGAERTAKRSLSLAN
jgi:sugar lactone lactonase YvrE